MKKFIFLDIDGVLAIPSCIKDGVWLLSDEKQKILEKILKKTNAKIVLSSSWRRETTDETKNHLKEKGFWFNNKLIGVTIRAHQYLEKGTKIHMRIPRGVEIKQWVDANIHSNNGKNYKKKELGKDYNYVILDNDNRMLLEHKDNFVQTNPINGLTKKDAKKVIKILLKK